MKIGLLAYHSVCNYGAFLQLLSTLEYLRKEKHDPVIINWNPYDLEKFYEKRSSNEVRELFSSFRNKYFPLTSLCRTSKDVADVISQYGIEAVIVGSDAVVQHHAFRERFKFPTKRIFHIAPSTSDRQYPNPFWGEFNKYLSHPVPLALISGSSQDSQFKYIKGKRKKSMESAIRQFSYYSVRDEWTQEMVTYLTEGKIVPPITPDPVFSFNQNAGHLIPTKMEILSKYGLPEKYILLGFKGKNYVSQDWISKFETNAKANNIACASLPFPDSGGFGNCEFNINSVLSPLDWYSLIKYSHGYIGNNMHPIVVSLHNKVPFFSFDYYGIVGQDESSKVYHILKLADLLKYRIFTRAKDYCPPEPENVFNAILHFDKSKLESFSKYYGSLYKEMMNNVINSIIR